MFSHSVFASIKAAFRNAVYLCVAFLTACRVCYACNLSHFEYDYIGFSWGNWFKIIIQRGDEMGKVELGGYTCYWKFS